MYIRKSLTILLAACLLFTACGKAGTIPDSEATASQKLQESAAAGTGADPAAADQEAYDSRGELFTPGHAGSRMLTAGARRYSLLSLGLQSSDIPLPPSVAPFYM